MGPFALALAIALSQGPKPISARVEGTVVDTLCAVVADAEVVAFVRGREVARGRSDGSGAFVFADLPHDVLIVRARGQGLAFAVARVDLTGDDFAAPRLQCFASRTLTGRVLGDGKPVAGAQVIAQPDDLPEFVDLPPLAVTGADGSYRLEGVVIGPARVRAWAPGCALLESASEGPRDAVVDFALHSDEAQDLVVEVQGATPVQIATARVLVTGERRGALMALPPGLTSARPDGDGVARFGGWPFDLARPCVVVRIPGVTTSPWRSDLLGLRGETVRFTVPALAASTLRGIVLGPDGRPLAHRQLLVQPYDDAAWSFEVVHGETHDDGSFALRCPVDKGRKFALRLVDDEWVADQSRADEPAGRAWHVATFDPDTVVQVTAAPAFNLRVRLRTPDGRPLGGAVLLVTGDAYDAMVLGSGQSRADGTAELIGLNVASFDTHSLYLESPQWGVRGLSITKTGDLDAQLARTMVCVGSIAGRVLDGELPLAGARVRLVQERATSKRILLPRPRVTVADAEGRFRFDGLISLPTELTASGLRVRCQVRAGAETTVTLR